MKDANAPTVGYDKVESVMAFLLMVVIVAIGLYLSEMLERVVSKR